MDIHSPVFAEEVYQLLQQAKSDPVLKKQVLQSPRSVLAKFSNELKNYDILIEEHDGYGLYFALKHHEITCLEQGVDDNQSANESFIEQHFMDCHNVYRSFALC